MESTIQELRKEMEEFHLELADEFDGGKSRFRINENPFNFITILKCMDGFYIFTHIKEDDGEFFYAKIADLYNIINNRIRINSLDGLSDFNNCVTSYLDFHGRK